MTLLSHFIGIQHFLIISLRRLVASWRIQTPKLEMLVVIILSKPVKIKLIIVSCVMLI